MAVALMDAEVQQVRASHGADCSCQLCRAIFEIQVLREDLTRQLEFNRRLVNDSTEREKSRTQQRNLTLGAMAAQLASTMPNTIPTEEVESLAMMSARRILALAEA